MTFTLSDLSVRSHYVLTRLIAFLNTLKGYERFDPSQPVRLFVSQDHSFCAVESVEFNWVFTATDHKLSEMIKSPFVPLVLPFTSFYDRVLTL